MFVVSSIVNPANGAVGKRTCLTIVGFSDPVRGESNVVCMEK